jgi:uncharacterized protein (TIGR02466 family)
LSTPASAALQIPNVTYQHLFTIPFLAHFWADNAELNGRLRDRIVARSREVQGESRSNRGGWHSESGQLEFLGDAREALIQQMYQLADAATQRVLAESGAKLVPIEWSFTAWANLSRAGASHAAHTHPGATWSGVYYVDPGESVPGDSAPLQLIDPCQGRANTFLPFLLPSTVHVQPKAGLMVLFPSYIGHTVFPYRGPGTRISIAFNLRKEPYP